MSRLTMQKNSERHSFRSSRAGMGPFLARAESLDVLGFKEMTLVHGDKMGTRCATFERADIARDIYSQLTMPSTL